MTEMQQVAAFVFVSVAAVCAPVLVWLFRIGTFAVEKIVFSVLDYDSDEEEHFPYMDSSLVRNVLHIIAGFASCGLVATMFAKDLWTSSYHGMVGGLMALWVSLSFSSSKIDDKPGHITPQEQWVWRGLFLCLGLGMYAFIMARMYDSSVRLSIYLGLAVGLFNAAVNYAYGVFVSKWAAQR